MNIQKISKTVEFILNIKAQAQENAYATFFNVLSAKFFENLHIGRYLTL